MKRSKKGKIAMAYTGHKTKTMFNGENIVDYIIPTIIQESVFHRGIPLPSREQAALVIRAMRMHPLLDYASKYDFSALGNPDEATRFYPTISSIGRFFRDAPLEILDEYRLKK